MRIRGKIRLLYLTNIDVSMLRLDHSMAIFQNDAVIDKPLFYNDEFDTCVTNRMALKKNL